MTKHQIAVAFRLANELIEELRPACERIEIAGSIRRQVPMVKDIELVACPKRFTDLLGEPAGSKLDPVLQALMVDGRVAPIKNGQRYKQLLLRIDGDATIKVDLFLVSAEAWGPALAIRTGPAEFSRRLVINRCHGGLLADGLTMADGYRLWRGRVVHEGGELEQTGTLVPCADEREFFEKHAGGWREPEDRSPAAPRPKAKGQR